MFGPAHRSLFEWRSRHIAVTNQRVLILCLADFNAAGIIEEEIAIAEVRLKLKDCGSVWRVSIYEHGARPRSTANLELDYRKSEFARETIDRCLQDLARNCYKQDGR